MQYITRKDGLKEGQKVYELLLYQAQLNSFPLEGMDDLFLDSVALENNTKSKEESKSKKVRLRRLYDTIFDFFLREKERKWRTKLTGGRKKGKKIWDLFDQLFCHLIVLNSDLQLQIKICLWQYRKALFEYKVSLHVVMLDGLPSYFKSGKALFCID